MRKLICKLLGHRWVTLMKAEEEGEIQFDTCLRHCGGHREYRLSCHAGPGPHKDIPACDCGEPYEEKVLFYALKKTLRDFREKHN